MTCFKIVPWSSFHEWKVVYHMLSQEQYESAIEILEMWQSRSVKISVAVECTLFYLSIKAEKERCSDLSQRLMLSSFVIKFVNGLVDREQVQFFAQSVTELATKLEIPRWISDLRHDCTHDKLPSLPVLEDACEMIFDWLWRNYWQPQYEYLEGLPLRIESELVTYKRYIKSYFRQHSSSLQLQEIVAKRVGSFFTSIPLVAVEASMRKELLKIMLLKPSLFISRKCSQKLYITKTSPPIARWHIWLPLVEELASANRWQCTLNDIVQILIAESSSMQSILTQMIDSIVQMLNASSSFAEARISFSFAFPYLKVPNTAAANIVSSFFGQLNKKDERLEAILLKISTTKESKPTPNSSLQDKQAQLEALRQKFTKTPQQSTPSCTIDEWTLCANWDFSIPLGYPPTHIESLFTYLQQEK